MTYRLLSLLALLLTASPAFAQSDYERADQPNLVEVVVATDALSTLETAVTTAGLADALSGDGPFTVFAPTNAAFEALPDGTVASLLEEANRDRLSGILTYHVVPGKLMAADLSDGQMLETLNGQMLKVSVEDGTVMISGATVASADVPASNGVAHVIDTVLLPSSDH